MSDRILTIPNAISFIRLLAIPYFWWVLLAQERVGLAAGLIFLIGGTDWVDGVLARRLDQVSEFGKLLDPVADRLMISSALIGGMIAGVVPAVIGWPLLAREALVGGSAVLLFSRGLGQLDVRPAGKVSTFLIYGGIASFYFVAADISTWLFAPPAWIAGVVGLILYWWVAMQYMADVRQRLSSLESPSRNQEV
ncbi:MAG TPA: CDP-alcohol phosphatidyltransferase family protein [Acidimicrobiia bacterium]|nr:CDP-alcohol phosphatidyltransferase family protein [Acidimicrobiia bacterium]